MRKTLPLILCAGATALMLSACGTTTSERVATGALGGAAVGAVLGGSTGEVVGGAAVGAVGGLAVDQAEKDRGN